MTLRVYGRIEYSEPLIELGAADEGTDLRKKYEADWVELVAFPDTAIQWIIRNGKTLDAD